MEKSTKLKIAVGVILTLTFLGTMITIIIFPPAAPYVAAIGSTLALAAGKQMVVQLIKRCFSRTSEKTEDEPPPKKESITHYAWASITKNTDKSKSGNHLTQTLTVESGATESKTNKPRL